ncbi:phage tail assembly protein [Agrobacterium tumefaciens]|uniref:phage tail assembly protein n=1 Tax=Agrobacterium tumefaciens TaxID=358 RepID=UPI0021CEA9E1|nr:phage tail assembly protein [Agrobacterium tumefaciens]UXT64230.1 phage tail assembly protein [Agrobacterium tumefaciens]
MRVDLDHPIIVAGRTLDAINVREPGRSAFEMIAAVSEPTQADTLNFVSRLSGLSVAAIRKLHPSDLARTGEAVSHELENARRQLRARKGLSS